LVIGKREKGKGKREKGRGKREEGKGKREKGKGKREEGKKSITYNNRERDAPTPAIAIFFVGM